MRFLLPSLALLLLCGCISPAPKPPVTFTASPIVMHDGNPRTATTSLSFHLENFNDAPLMLRFIGVDDDAAVSYEVFTLSGEKLSELKSERNYRARFGGRVTDRALLRGQAIDLPDHDTLEFAAPAPGDYTIAAHVTVGTIALAPARITVRVP